MMQRNTLRVNSASVLLWCSAGFLLLGAIAMIPYGDFRQPEVVPKFWGAMVLMGLGYGLSWRLKSVPGRWFWGVAILTRVALLPMYPGDDIWRYLWEGYIQTQGFSPYHFAPTAPELLPLRTDWWELMNYPETSAIYPPAAQLGFRLLAFFPPRAWLFKLAFVIADLGICGLLSRRFGREQTILYAWSPLVIYAFAGGGHYDSWFILPLVLAWLSFEVSDSPRLWLQSTAWLGLSIALKWISLPILGFVSWYAWRQRGFRWAIAVVVLGILPFILGALLFCDGTACPLVPTQSQFITNARSADVVPYLFGFMWPPSREMNWIFVIPLALVWSLLLWRSPSFQTFASGYLLALFMISPIVHAWYFTWWLPFAVATQNWGGRLISLSVFIYFILQYRASLGDWHWILTPGERVILWLPLLCGLLWTWFLARREAGQQAMLRRG